MPDPIPPLLQHCAVLRATSHELIADSNKLTAQARNILTLRREYCEALRRKLHQSPDAA